MALGSYSCILNVFNYKLILKCNYFRWIYVKDVPNNQLRHIRLENNENKSVTNSRDTQEVPYNQGVQVLRIIHSYKHETSIFDDFQHYENLQKLEDSKKSAATFPPSSHSTINKHNLNGPVRMSNDIRPQQNYYNKVCYFVITCICLHFYEL